MTARFICTHQGLEPMIWSSARPDNVKAMSELAFGPFKHHLKAIWARDTLGLSAQDFRMCFYFIDAQLLRHHSSSEKKVQTVKDLNSVWHQLSDDSGIFTGEPLTYSALNTILVDDSLVKAHLQPHNHICLPDYDATLRELDVEQSLTDSGDGDALSKEDAQIGISSRYDLSLVAVMGVLDELANQDSVCSWISSGGLRNIPGLSTGTSGEIGNKGKTASELLNEGAPFTSSSPGHNEIPAPGPVRSSLFIGPDSHTDSMNEKEKEREEVAVTYRGEASPGNITITIAFFPSCVYTCSHNHPLPHATILQDHTHSLVRRFRGFQLLGQPRCPDRQALRDPARAWSLESLIVLNTVLALRVLFIEAVDLTFISRTAMEHP